MKLGETVLDRDAPPVSTVVVDHGDAEVGQGPLEHTRRCRLPGRLRFRELVDGIGAVVDANPIDRLQDRATFRRL